MIGWLDPMTRFVPCQTLDRHRGWVDLKQAHNSKLLVSLTPGMCFSILTHLRFALGCTLVQISHDLVAQRMVRGKEHVIDGHTAGHVHRHPGGQLVSEILF